MINVRLITSPFTLVKHDVQGDSVDFIWPKEMHIYLEENEGLYFQDDCILYTVKWIEDIDYHEEIIIRDGEILERTPTLGFTDDLECNIHKRLV